MKGKAFCRRFSCRVPQDAIEGIGKICVILLAASCHWLQQEYCRVLWLLQCCHSTEQVWVESKSYLQHLELVDMLLIYNAKVLILDLCIMDWHRNLFWEHKSVCCKILHVTIRLEWLANLNCVCSSWFSEHLQKPYLLWEQISILLVIRGPHPLCLLLNLEWFNKSWACSPTLVNPYLQ